VKIFAPNSAHLYLAGYCPQVQCFTLYLPYTDMTNGKLQKRICNWTNPDFVNVPISTSLTKSVLCRHAAPL